MKMNSEKQAARSTLEERTAPQRRDSVGTKRSMEPPQPTPGASGGCTTAAPRERSGSNVSGILSLKRFRLSASPATGLVGLQENAFLSDYFECLGFFPLASESMIRQAMVSIMLDSMSQKRQGRVRSGAGGLSGRRKAGDPRQDQDGCGGEVLACHDRADYPSKCIFWCAIALGALVQGCSSAFVAGYLKLARDSLTECFDGTTVETARAYLVMAFLYRFLGDKDKNRRYLAFSKSIVERLPQDATPLGLENMILAQGNESSFIHCGWSGSSDAVKDKEKSEPCVQIPEVNTFEHERDLCNFYFLADRCMHHAFSEDIRKQVDLANITALAGRAHGRGVSEEPVECRGQGKRRGTEESRDWEGRGIGAPLQSSSVEKEFARSQGHRDPPPAGGAIETCIKDLFPEMAIRVAAINSCMAYMNAVKGEMSSSFESMTVCANVLMRFPGICRYRPHLVHSILTAAASSMCREVYDPVRAIYNSILPWNGTPAPPMEEWSGMTSICNNVFCRSLLSETNKMDFASNDLGFSHARAVAASVPSAHSSVPHAASVSGETNRPCNCRGCGEEPVA